MVIPPKPSPAGSRSILRPGISAPVRQWLLAGVVAVMPCEASFNLRQVGVHLTEEHLSDSPLVAVLLGATSTSAPMSLAGCFSSASCTAVAHRATPAWRPCGR